MMRMRVVGIARVALTSAILLVTGSGTISSRGGGLVSACPPNCNGKEAIITGVCASGVCLNYSCYLTDPCGWTRCTWVANQCYTPNNCTLKAQNSYCEPNGGCEPR